jgi:hypothetical protein
MNHPPQPQPTQPADPDMALLFLGSWFATLHDAPKRNHAKLNALAWHILGERPKTLLGLAIKACAEKWLRRRLWMVDFDILSPSEQRACVVIEIATRLGHGQAAEAKDGSSAIHFSSGRITQAATVLGAP